MADRDGDTTTAAPPTTHDDLVVLGRASRSPDELKTLARPHDEVLIDLGTGDGRFALRTARARPEALVIAIDPVAEAMQQSAARAARKPARGGAANVVFVVAGLERLPAALHGLADTVTINYPWGSLLRAVAWPEPEGLAAAVRLLAPDGLMIALLNASAAERPDYAARNDLPPLNDPEHVQRRLLPGWKDAGLEGFEWRYLAPGEQPPHRTSWGQRLVRGSGRETLLISGLRASSSTAL